MNTKKYIISKELLIKEYSNTQKSMFEVSKIFGCSIKVIRNRLIEYNIPIRTRTETSIGKKRPSMSKRFEGSKNPFFGKHHTKEVRKKMREAKLKNPTNYWLGKKRSKETIEKITKNHVHLIGKDSPSFGMKRSKKTKEKIRQTLLKHWEDSEFRNRMINSFIDNEISSFEQRIINIIKKYKLPFKYVGNWDFIIAGFCPDFVNVNGKEQLIEVYANYFKIKDYGSINRYKKIRRAIFKRYGYETLFIGEKELKENDRTIAQTIKIFSNKEITKK